MGPWWRSRAQRRVPGRWLPRGAWLPVFRRAGHRTMGRETPSGPSHRLARPRAPRPWGLRRMAGRPWGLRRRAAPRWPVRAWARSPAWGRGAGRPRAGRRWPARPWGLRRMAGRPEPEARAAPPPAPRRPERPRARVPPPVRGSPGPRRRCPRAGLPVRTRARAPGGSPREPAGRTAPARQVSAPSGWARSPRREVPRRAWSPSTWGAPRQRPPAPRPPRRCRSRQPRPVRQRPPSGAGGRRCRRRSGVGGGARDGGGRVHHQHRALELRGAGALQVEATLAASRRRIRILGPTVRTEHSTPPVPAPGRWWRRAYTANVASLK
jgi:hypothetical protein